MVQAPARTVQGDDLRQGGANSGRYIPAAIKRFGESVRGTAVEAATCAVQLRDTDTQKRIQVSFSLSLSRYQCIVCVLVGMYAMKPFELQQAVRQM